MSSAISFVKKYTHPIAVALSVIIVLVLGPYLIYNINYMGRIYPNTFVAGYNLGGLTPEVAINYLSQKIVVPTKISLLSQTKSFDISTKDIDLDYNFTESVDRAYNLTRTGNIFLDFSERVRLLTNKVNLGIITKINDSELNKEISKIDLQISVNPTYPSVEIINGAIQVNRGVKGSKVDIGLLRANIGNSLAYAKTDDNNIPIKIIDSTIDDQTSDKLKLRAQKFLGKSLILKYNSQSFDYSDKDILRTLDPLSSYSDTEINNILLKVASSVNRDPQNSKFEFNGTRVTEFQPALDGILVDTNKFRELLTSGIDQLSEITDKSISLDIPVLKTKPDITMDQVNDLGIKELIGHGDSTYFHSIPGRVFNVNLAASRINGTLVKPGDTFSFNQTLGDVSKFTGYQQAYIISGGRTVLGDGGGVCQVSTTLFRAVLNAGLPIAERSAHAYRVGYYEQNSPPGLDATVYSPSPDFKFTNDTGSYILVEAKNDPANYSLVFDLYGTSDGRVSALSKPIVSNYSPPLPTVYQDDPTLPIGTQKQTDFAAAGAKVTFNYSVTRAGDQIYKKTFVSNYQPWAAVFLRGTKN